MALSCFMPLWWWHAASNGDDAHCCNCAFNFQHPQGFLACRLRGGSGQVAENDCCTNWLDSETHDSPFDAALRYAKEQAGASVQTAGA